MNKEFLKLTCRKTTDKTMIWCLSRLYPIKCVWQIITKNIFATIREAGAEAGDAAQWLGCLLLSLTRIAEGEGSSYQLSSDFLRASAPSHRINVNGTQTTVRDHWKSSRGTEAGKADHTEQEQGEQDLRLPQGHRWVCPVVCQSFKLAEHHPTRLSSYLTLGVAT